MLGREGNTDTRAVFEHSGVYSLLSLYLVIPNLNFAAGVGSDEYARGQYSADSVWSGGGADLNVLWADRQ